MQLYSDEQSDNGSVKVEKPKNRNKFTHKGLHFSSDFAGGNLKSISIKDQIAIQGKLALVIQFWGNSDCNSDTKDKSWFCFNVSGIRDTKTLKYAYLLFRFKNANVYRKFIREKKYKPYVVIKENRQKLGCDYKTILVSKISQPVQNQQIQAQFVYNIQPGIDKATFSLNLCYGLSDLDIMNRKIIQSLQSKRNSSIYYHRQIIAESIDCHPVYMLTVTSNQNIASYKNYQPDLWPTKSQRTFELKNKPQILITARVHPSETSSSFCLEGIIESLVNNKGFQILLSMFIFRIVPIMNPDGVENGHYRLDNYLQNLNRFYGHSDAKKTPSVFAVERLITNLKQKNRLFIFVDIHGHNSAKPSFIFGNYTSNFCQALQNRAFVKLFELIAGESRFSSVDCDFSKRNMSLKQRYDQHSKQASARVFAYQGIFSSQNNISKSDLIVQHSYTLQVHPYCLRKQNGDTLIQNQSPAYAEIIKEYKLIGECFLITILELIGVNASFNIVEAQECKTVRRKCIKEVSRQIQFYDRLKREKDKDASKEAFQKYNKKWGLAESFKSFINKNNEGQTISKQKLKECPLYQIIQQQEIKGCSSLTKLGKKGTKEHLSPVRRQKEELEKLQITLPNFQSSGIARNKKLDILSPKSFIQQEQKQECNEIQFEDKDKKEIEIANLYNYMEMKMHERAENYYKNFNVQNQQILKNYSPTFSVQNKMKNADNQSIGELEKRAKRLLFRHKTQMQNKQPLKKVKNKYILKFDFGPLDRSTQQEAIRGPSKPSQLDNPLVKNLEPLSKARSKQVKLKTEIPRDQKYNLNSILFKHRKSSYKEKMTELKSRVVSSENPKIKQLLKRVSFSKNQQSNKIVDEEFTPINQVKANRTVLSNLILLKARKKNVYTGLEAGEKQDIIHSLSNNCMLYDNNHSIISLVHQSKMLEELKQQNYYSNSIVGLQGSYRSVTPLPKKEEASKKPQDNLDQKMSLQTLRKNNIQYLEKVKNQLQEKKKIFRTALY